MPSVLYETKCCPLEHNVQYLRCYGRLLIQARNIRFFPADRIPLNHQHIRKLYCCAVRPYGPEYINDLKKTISPTTTRDTHADILVLGQQQSSSNLLASASPRQLPQHERLQPLALTAAPHPEMYAIPRVGAGAIFS